jgi:hypothetical protein
MIKAIGIIMIFLISISLVLGLKVTTEARIFGYGEMLAETDGGPARDLAGGIGEQHYYRELATEPDKMTLMSKYDLKSNSNEKRFYLKDINGTKTNYYQLYEPNRYSMQMASPSGLLQSVSVRGFSGASLPNLTTSSTIIFNAPSVGSTSSKSLVATGYYIEGAGNFTEKILDRTKGKHAETLASMWISSPHFRISSSLADDKAFQTNDATAAMLASQEETSTTVERSAPIYRELNKLDEQFDEKIINSTEYLNGLQQIAEKGELDSNVIMDVLKSRAESGQIKKEEYVNVAQSMANKEEKIKRIDEDLALYKKDLDNNLITKNDYLNVTEDMYISERISASTILRLYKSMHDEGKLDDAEYSAAKEKIFEREQNIGTIDIELKNLEDSFDQTKEKAKYLSDLRTVWINNKISSTRYLTITKARLDKGDIDNSDYTFIKQEVFAREGA